MSERQVVLDTETTGIDPKSGHRIIEIGCVELIDRQLTGNHYHQYINPDRAIEAEAQAIHGISAQMLKDEPFFKDIAVEFVNFINGAELIIHNAPFDVGHINAEFERLPGSIGLQTADITHICSILDTLKMARRKHPGQRNSLDALCKRYGIDNSQRTLHGALLDSEILAEVYLAMTGGQMELSFDMGSNQKANADASSEFTRPNKAFKVIEAQASELQAHQDMLTKLESISGVRLWV